jgi:excinuclease ABC subunit A
VKRSGSNSPPSCNASNVAIPFICWTSPPPDCIPADVQLLMAQLHRLVDAGNTVIVVEHEMDVVAGADWVIDLGPGGGDAGGRIMIAGPPAVVARSQESRTAPYLAAVLARL